MKIVHSAIATPRKCGLYETAHELVKAERSLGHDARIYDPKPIPSLHPGKEDRGVPLCEEDWATTADVIVSHSGHDKTPLAETKQPIVHAIHGRPISTFIMEREGGAPAYSYAVARRKLERYKGAVTFWPQYKQILQQLWGAKPVEVLPPTCDMEYWSPGPTGYDFAGKGGEYNVVVADVWSRRDVCPITMVHAFNEFRKFKPTAKLHIYGLDGNEKGLQAVRALLGSNLGIIQGWAADLRQPYRAADMLISPHRIYVRSIREAAACGLQVVSGMDCHPEDVGHFAKVMFHRTKHPHNNRKMAEKTFDPVKSAAKLIQFLEQVI